MRIGSLFAGMGGLDRGVQAALGGTVAWHSEVDKGACKVLAHRYPDVPNLGDITAVDWSAVEPVDVLTGGFPCQDVSTAGKRAGMTPDTRSGLWTHMAYAIDRLRPRLVVAENVRGLLSATATSDLEPCPWCLGDGEGVAPLRALGAVLGDLAVLGYDARWYGLRAADVGAPHGRFRVFVVAWDAASDNIRHESLAGCRETRRTPQSPGSADRTPANAPDAAGRFGLEPGTARGAGSGGEGEARAHLREDARGGTRGTLLPTPTSRDHKGRNQRGDVTCLTGALLPMTCTYCGEPRTAARCDNCDAGPLLPTPRATDGTKGGPGQRGSSGDLMLPSAVTLLPTPCAEDAKASGGAASRNDGRQVMLHHAAKSQQWGQYADAIARWEALTRPAPPPTQLSTKGTPQLSPAFSEWMLGLPAGWVTDVPGITRNEALKALGNGVVPAQCEAALRYLLDIEAGAA